MKFGKIQSFEETCFTRPSGYGICNYDGYVITCECDTVYIGIESDQNCCESWGYLSSNGEDLDYYVGAELLSVSVVDENSLKTEVFKQSGVWEEDTSIMFVDVETSRGVFQIAAYNSHNGYYGHDAVVITKESTVTERL